MEECIYCGCTEDSPCLIERAGHVNGFEVQNGLLLPCSWHRPGVCTNPECMLTFVRGKLPENAETFDQAEQNRMEIYQEEDAFDMGIDLWTRNRDWQRDVAGARREIDGRG